MPAQWTAEVVGKMHIFGITGKTLAEALNWHPKYLSRVLNSANPPKEASGKVQAALDCLISQRNTS